LEGLISKLGVERRLHTAGTNKARLDPFSPEKDDDVQWLLGMQSDIHGEFGAWVRERRGDQLCGTDEELFTGEVWIGRKAVEPGLADPVGDDARGDRRALPGRRAAGGARAQVAGRAPGTAPRRALLAACRKRRWRWSARWSSGRAGRASGSDPPRRGTMRRP
jgi:ClpP class serine protease